MKNKPLVLIDFDGVFNALNHERVWCGENRLTELDLILRDPKNWKIVSEPISNDTHYTPDRNEVVEFEERKVRIQWSTELVDEFNEFVRSSGVDVMWLTTWQEAAITVLNPTLGINVPVNNWVRADGFTGPRFFITSYDYHQEGKLVAVKNMFEGLPEAAKQPVVWFEDVATVRVANSEDPSNKKLEEMLGVPALAFHVEGSKGISRAEMAQMKQWVETFC